MYQMIFNNIYNGVLVTDADGYVTHFNKPYGVFLGVDPDAQIGRHCTEVLENTRMHIVAKTGKPEINQPHMVKGQNMVVQRIPIKKNGKVIAVFGQVMFKDVRDVSRLANVLSLLESKVEFYEKELMNLRSTRYTFESIIGPSQSIKRIKEEARRASSNQFPVLIAGESGTGKELFAQAIHHSSPRNIHPFIRINCAAIPRDLVEAELFGYEKGAFTGASPKGKPGKFELAHRGTIFLDEIGDFPLEMQPKLLRVLEEKEFERVGGNAVIHSDFRLIAATNQNLEEMMDKREFRKDLFYRLNVISLNIPPLRERRDDIVPIARHMLKQLDPDAVRAETNIDAEALQILVNYKWPGNARELSNVLERTLASMDGDMIRHHDLPFYLRRGQEEITGGGAYSLKEAQVQAEKDMVKLALKESGNNKTRAAELLGIHRTLLYKKIRKYGLPLNAGK